MAMRKSKGRTRLYSNWFWPYFSFQCVTFLTEYRMMQRRRNGQMLEVRNQCVLLLWEWNEIWLSSTVKFLKWCETTISSRQVPYSNDSKSGQMIFHNHFSHSAETHPYMLLCVNAVLVKVYVFIIHWQGHPLCNLKIETDSSFKTAHCQMKIKQISFVSFLDTSLPKHWLLENAWFHGHILML